MKIGFIAGKAQKSFECLAIRAKERGHSVTHIPIADIPLSHAGVTDFVKRCADEFNVLHSYIGLADPISVEFGQVCDDLSIPLLNNRAHIPHLVHNKMYQTLQFSRFDLPVPKN